MMCWPGLRERPLDDHVVQGHGCGELTWRAIAAQLVGHPIEALEQRAVPPAELGRRSAKATGERTVADADDLVHEAMKEDGVARLVDLLGREKVLLLLQRRRVDVGRQVVGDQVLAVEEQRVEPQRPAPLLVGEAVQPVLAVP